LAKNWALTGNPTYPLLYDWFDGLARTAAKNDQWARVHSPPNYDLGDLARRAGGATFASDWLSPILVPLAALALTLWARQPWVRVLAVYWLYVFATWWLFRTRVAGDPGRLAGVRTCREFCGDHVRLDRR
jgi:hypothetical protein